MSLIRAFADADYPAITRVANEVWPDYPSSEEERRHRDATQDPKLSHTRWVAEERGEVVAWAHLGQDAIVYHPQKFDWDVMVLATHRRRGVGGALYQTLLCEAKRQGAIHLRAFHREDMPPGVAFLEELGYKPELWEQESTLDLQAFDPAPWQDKVAAVRATGIRICRYCDLEVDEALLKRVYEADVAFTKDMPASDTITRPAYQNWQERHIERPGFLPEAFLLALDGEEVVGISNLIRRLGDPNLWVGTTGVTKSHRRRGIATALKVLATLAGKELGAPAVRTWNEQHNEGMLRINVAMGFVMMPKWITYGLALATGGGSGGSVALPEVDSAG